MTRCLWIVLLGMLAVSGIAGCMRADLYAVSSESSGSTSAMAGSSATGSSATGSSAGAVNTAQQGTRSVTCPSPARQVGDTIETLKVGSVSRSYVLHVPATYDGTSPVPLIVDFHGMGGSGLSELTSSPYPAVTDPDGVIMAFPDGLTGPLGTAWNAGPCCVADVDDVAFARALVAHVQSLVCIDPIRIYAVGVLTGGGMVYTLACRAADMFAAVAPAAFDLLEENVADCNPLRPITEISFRGTSDPRVPYNGGASSLVPGMPITFLGARATFDRWAQIDRCNGSPSEQDNNGCASYSGCEGGVEVILCTKQGGRDDPGNANVAWPLLKRHTL